MSPNSEHSELKDILLENQRLLAENNELLKKMRRSAVRHFWINVAYILVFLGLPFILYYYLMAPYMDMFQSVVPGAYKMDSLLELQSSAWRGIEQR